MEQGKRWENIPEGSLATITGTSVTGRRATAVVVGCRRSAGLSLLRNNLSSRRIATGRRGGSSLLLLAEAVVLLERHDADGSRGERSNAGDSRNCWYVVGLLRKFPSKNRKIFEKEKS